MTYFRTQDVAAITVFATLWGILNSLISPIVFQVFNIPFTCDLIGFASIILATWYVKKIGTATMVGFIATIINFMLIPNAIHFLGFTAASIAFDVLAFTIGYKRLFEKKRFGSVCLFTISVSSAAFAGFLIGFFFMPSIALQRWGGTLGWAGMHAAGGVLGGALGVTLMNALASRGIQQAQK